MTVSSRFSPKNKNFKQERKYYKYSVGAPVSAIDPESFGRVSY